LREIFIMKICAAQLKPIAGDVTANIDKHLALIQLASTLRAQVLFFPELSLTGYEPRLANTLASNQNDARLDVLQQCCNEHDMIIAVGMPVAVTNGVQIGMIWLAPHLPPRTYAKQQLHADELPYFVPGTTSLLLTTDTQILAPAICYESLQMNHADAAASAGATLYIASVAKSAGGIAKAMTHYPAVARKHNMQVIMANCIGPCDDFTSVGQSAAWNARGELLTQMDSESEGVVLLDTAAQRASVHCLK